MNVKDVLELTDIDFVIGMPPKTYVSDVIMENSMPTATIVPCKPDFAQGLSLFRLEESMSAFNDELKKLGYSVNKNAIEVAFLADNFPSDSFVNDYGETFLDKFAQAASSGISDAMQIMGSNNLGDVAKMVKSAAGEGMISKGITSGQEGIAKLEALLTSTAAAHGKEGVAKGIIDTGGAVLTGARIDFPKVWKNSGFGPSYTMTIRLYNPNPANPESTNKYIVGPLAVLLSLALPRAAEDGTTYKWPYLCKIRAKGIYNLHAGFVSNITIVKGGDQQNIAWNQALAMVDVRLDFGSLYDSMIIEGTPFSLNTKRPTLANYLETIGGNPGTGASGKRKIEPNIKNHYVYDTPPLGRVEDLHEERKLKKYINVSSKSNLGTTETGSRASETDKTSEVDLKPSLVN